MLYLFRNSIQSSEYEGAGEHNILCVNKMSELIQRHKVAEGFIKGQLQCFLDPYFCFI